MNLWDDHSIDLLLREFMTTIHGYNFERPLTPNKYITIYDPK